MSVFGMMPQSAQQRIRQRVLDPTQPAAPDQQPARFDHRATAVGPGTAPSQAPASPFNYEAARDDWMGNNEYSRDEAGAGAWAQKHGVQYSGGDVINLPNGGGQIDILGNFKSGQNVARNWTAAGGNGDNPNGAPAGGGGGAAGGGGAFNDQVRARIMAQLDAMGKDPTADDPAIANRVNAFRREKERAGQNQRAALAERAAASGLLQGNASSGAFDTGVHGIQEGIGEDVGAYAADAVTDEQTSRRDQLGRLMALAAQSGDNEMARSLQLQLAQMDNSLRGRMFDSDDRFRRDRAAEDDFRYGLDFGYR